MVEPVTRDYDEESSLLQESSIVDGSWRLNFDGFEVSSELKEKKPSSGIHDCLGVLRTEDTVAEYYQQQVEMLEGFTEMDALAERGFIPGMSKEEKEKLAKSETFAIRISNIANMVLFAAKVYASVRSGSLAIIASTLDSLLDLLSGFILWFTAFSMQTPSPYQYPIGKKRMQPLIPPVLDPLPRVVNNGTTPQNFTRTNPVSVHPMPADDANQPDRNNIVKAEFRSSTASGSSLSKEQHDVAGPPVKRRKRHRRKHAQNQEPCLMRGVYFKNMKWQAAIKVDKKQIHLGTVGSQEEAAHLYDRAAFMCGREPNFELSEEEKKELRKFKWDEFLAMTRHAITNKKHRRRSGAESEKRSESPQLEDANWEDDKEEVNVLSASEDAEQYMLDS